MYLTMAKLFQALRSWSCQYINVILSDTLQSSKKQSAILLKMDKLVMGDTAADCLAWWCWAHLGLYKAQVSCKSCPLHHQGGAGYIWAEQCSSFLIVQELCESRGGRPGLSVLMSLLVSVDVKIYCTMLRHWSQLVPNISTDIWGH